MLEVKNLGVRYGRHLALEGVSAKIAKGEICVILGANGAGKSSLLKAIAGLVKTEPGTEITMNGKPIRGVKAHRIVEEGIALVPEGRGIFGDLTVAENLQLGAFAGRARQGEAETLKRIYELFPRLGERKGQIARTMSGGEQQMVAIGRALMSKPDILMLDEPSLGLSPLLSKELFKSLKAVAATGVGILLVEQNAKLSLKIADRGYLIENGLITGEDTAVNLMNDPAVANAYLGGGKTDDARRTARRGIALPPFLALPATLEAMGRMAGDLARRAGAIQTAFVRYLRRENAAPSAFAGRYDPKAGPDPWEVAARETAQPKPASVDADRLSEQAAELAQRAHERLAAHVASSRLTRGAGTPPPPKRPAFVTPSAEPRRTDLALDAAALADRATRRLAAHVAGRRKPVERPVLPRKQVAAPAAKLNGGHGLVGHNSAGFDIDHNEPAAPLVPQRIDLSSVVARAAAIQAQHVAARRKTLAAFTIPPQPAAKLDADSHPKKKSPKKRKKHKEA
ncbi:MAG: ABC transporter ATP-binding protein [Rhizobiaceae bacterium]|nr:ABC transporter ATP-binding protein [Rhizobiaceae bacterium]